MKWIVLLVCLWACPVSFANDTTEEDAAPAARPKVVSGCPGGKCQIGRPIGRPRPVR